MKPIVLVGGSNASGKTYLARELLSTGTFDHMLGTGFIREILRSTVNRDSASPLLGYSFEGNDPVRTLHRQARALSAAVIACIQRAEREGTAIVIEGTHIVPSLYAHLPEVTEIVVLVAPEQDEKARWSWLTDSHNRRKFTSGQLDAIREMDSWFSDEAGRAAIPVLRTLQDRADFTQRFRCPAARSTGS
jgi:2-phosphoglycerate kinase